MTKEHKAGPKEILTLALARKIVLMIHNFPDAGIDTTWDNVIRQTKMRFGHEFRRHVLSQKTWDGRKLIAEAFQDAKEIQRRKGRDTAPKYANESRSRLRNLVSKLQSEILTLRGQMEQVRAAQYDEIHSLLDTRTPLGDLTNLRLKNSKNSVVELKKPTQQTAELNKKT